MVKIKEQSLIDVLAYCDLRDLPKEDSKEFVWLKAIALVAKSDGSTNYAYLSKDLNGKPRVKKDFGNIAAIKEIKAVYPFMLLDEKFMPDFKTNSKDERIEWLEKSGCTDDLSSLKLKELNEKVLNMAIQHALALVNR